MPTVHSLVCWGGLTGKTVTLTDAGDIVNLTNHGLRDGKAVQFVSGSMPSPLALNTPYYAKSTGTGTFTLYTTSALTTQVTWTGSGTGPFVMQSVLRASLTTAQKARYGEPDSERIYDGLSAWNSGRSGASPLDTEVCELLEAYDDRVTSALTINIPAAACLITSKVNGVRSEAFHGGVIGAGYAFYQASNSASLITVSSLRTTTDGFTIKVGSGWYGSSLLSFTGFLGSPINMIVIGPGGIASVGGNGVGITVGGGATCLNNLVAGCLKGFSLVTYAVGLTVGNNFATKCGTGFGASAATNVQGNLYNNISIGNTTNWQSVTGTYAATNNAGLAGEAWMQGSGSSRLTISIDDFVDYAAGDYRPALVTSPQVDTGSAYYGMLDRDIAGNEAPNYNGGGAEVIDVGPYEFDHGYGDHPATATIGLSNIVSGSRVLITRDDTSAVLYNDVPGASLSIETGYIGNFSVVIRKASESPYYREFSAGGSTVTNQTTSIKALQQLDE